MATKQALDLIMMLFRERILGCLITQELEREERRNQVVKEAEVIVTLQEVVEVKATMIPKDLNKRRDVKGNNQSVA